MEPRQDKTDDWHERSQAEMRTMVWSQPSIKHSFYKNSLRRGVHAEPVAPRRLLGVDPRSRTRATSSSVNAQSSRQLMFLANVRRVVGDGAQFVAALDVRLHHHQEVHRVVRVLFVAPLAVAARSLQDRDARRLVDAAVAGILHPFMISVITQPFSTSIEYHVTG